jgi:hypothetical protein
MKLRQFITPFHLQCQLESPKHGKVQTIIVWEYFIQISQTTGSSGVGKLCSVGKTIDERFNLPRRSAEKIEATWFPLLGFSEKSTHDILRGEALNLQSGIPMFQLLVVDPATHINQCPFGDLHGHPSALMENCSLPSDVQRFKATAPMTVAIMASAFSPLK